MFGLEVGAERKSPRSGHGPSILPDKKKHCRNVVLWLRAGILVTSLQPPVLNSLHLEGRPADTRVVVAMSGGVDSSVVAALLKAEGYDVVGITLQLYDHGEAVGRKGACCAGQDIQDARRVADLLKIPHYVLDYESALRQRGDGRVRRQLSPGRDAGPLRRLQPEDQVPRSLGDGRGAWAPRRWPPAIMSGASRAARVGALPRRRQGARPELFPVRHHARATRLSPLPARRPREGRDAQACPRLWAWRWPRSRTVRISVSCPPGAIRK